MRSQLYLAPFKNIFSCASVSVPFSPLMEQYVDDPEMKLYIMHCTYSTYDIQEPSSSKKQHTYLNVFQVLLITVSLVETLQQSNYAFPVQYYCAFVLMFYNVDILFSCQQKQLICFLLYVCRNHGRNSIQSLLDSIRSLFCYCIGTMIYRTDIVSWCLQQLVQTTQKNIANGQREFGL